MNDEYFCRCPGCGECAAHAAARRSKETVKREVPDGRQPIETAPKDIEFRCLLSHGLSIVTGYWDGEKWVNERSRSWSANRYDPTHWMPLPAAPKVTP